MKSPLRLQGLLQPCGAHRRSQGPDRGRPRLQARQHVLGRTEQPQRPHALAADDAADKRLFEKGSRTTRTQWRCDGRWRYGSLLGMRDVVAVLEAWEAVR